MKRFFIILLATLAAGLSMSAQDVITKRDGTDIAAKVLEINPSDVKYKKAENPEGPTYTMARSEILLICYENGQREVFDEGPALHPEYIPNTTYAVVPGMKYREYKKYYDTNEYIPRFDDPYSRGWNGFASAVISGLGQCIEGEWGRGLAFFGSNLILLVGEIASWKYTPITNDTYEISFTGWTYALYAARLGLNIWSICDAVHIAKVKNMYYQDIRAQRSSLDCRVEPFFTCARTSTPDAFTPAACLSLRVSF